MLQRSLWMNGVLFHILFGNFLINVWFIQWLNANNRRGWMDSWSVGSFAVQNFRRFYRHCYKSKTFNRVYAYTSKGKLLDVAPRLKFSFIDLFQWSNWKQCKEALIHKSMNMDLCIRIVTLEKSLLKIRLRAE